ncbi:hypothetical protein [Coprobacter secundus]|uniref:hypothetical protein n=1 Tax=Coprobacter secundus TaxID=1501392 RepID=UPI003522E777
MAGAGNDGFPAFRHQYVYGTGVGRWLGRPEVVQSDGARCGAVGEDVEGGRL